MGARTTWKIVTNDSGAVTWLYSHWGGESKFDKTQRALIHAMPRWGDETYGARSFISAIVGNDWSDTTGFGITATLSDAEVPFEESYFNAVIDFTTQRVTFGSREWSFDEFIVAQDCSDALQDEYYASEFV
jgi:hypothetical protein